jgi:hypothetical protein
MITLTRDFHVLTSRVTASFPTVFLSVGHVAQTWYVRALFRFLICHCDSILSSSIHFSSLSTTILDAASADPKMNLRGPLEVVLLMEATSAW